MMRADIVRVVKRVVLALLAVAVLLAAVAVALLLALSASIRDYYPTPFTNVDGYEELRAALADHPEMRFADLSEYGEATDCVVSRDRRTGTIQGLWYHVGAQGASGRIGIDCRDLSQYDGHYSVAPEVAPNMEHAGVQIERWHYEGVATEEDALRNLPVGGCACTTRYLFDLDGYYYDISVNYELPPDAGEDEVRAAHEAAEEETRKVAYTIIDQ